MHTMYMYVIMHCTFLLGGPRLGLTKEWALTVSVDVAPLITLDTLHIAHLHPKWLVTQWHVLREPGWAGAEGGREGGRERERERGEREGGREGGREGEREKEREREREREKREREERERERTVEEHGAEGRCRVK